MTTDPPPRQMLFEACVDCAETLKLLRLGAEHNTPFGEALQVINAAIEQLEYAISAALDAKEAA